MSELTREVLENEYEPNVTRVVQRMLTKMVSERDYSAQEVFWVLNGHKFYRSSRKFETINLADDQYFPIEIDAQNNAVRRKDLVSQ